MFCSELPVDVADMKALLTLYTVRAIASASAVHVMANSIAYMGAGVMCPNGMHSVREVAAASSKVREQQTQLSHSAT